MPKVIPFKACRPTRDKAGLVASRSFIEYSEEDLSEKLINNPYTFLHVIYPDFGTPGWHDQSQEYRFSRVRKAYEDFLDQNFLKRDEEASFYVYRQLKDGYSYTGIIGGVSTQDYDEGRVKVHEHTITAREEMFKEYLKHTSINAEPVLLAYPNVDTIDALLEEITNERADFEFTTTDRATHYLWPITNPNHIDLIQQKFAEVEAFYIADGHHRSASSALLAKDLNNNTAAQYSMCYLLAESQMNIMSFSRFVKHLNGSSEEDFLEKIKSKFTVTPSDEAVQPTRVHEFGMYMNHKWYTIVPHKDLYDEAHPVKHLDCSILDQLVLNPILGIEDAKTDSRISFQGEHIGTQGVERLVNSGRYEVGFTLYPVTMSQLKLVADTNNIMPPKSTWVEPKLRSGLVIYEF